MELKQRLTAYIIKHAPVTMDRLIEKATAQGFTELEVLTALETVHKDKRIQQTANTAGVVTYKLAIAKATPSTEHLTWIRYNYPPMDSTNDGSGIEADYSYMFLSPDELKEYKAAAKGVPVHMLESKYGKSRKRSAT